MKCSHSCEGRMLFLLQGANTSDKEDDRDVSDAFKKLDMDLDE